MVVVVVVARNMSWFEVWYYDDDEHGLPASFLNGRWVCIYVRVYIYVCAYIVVVLMYAYL